MLLIYRLAFVQGRAVPDGEATIQSLGDRDLVKERMAAHDFRRRGDAGPAGVEHNITRLFVISYGPEPHRSKGNRSPCPWRSRGAFQSGIEGQSSCSWLS